MKRIILYAVFLMPLSAIAQNSLTLEDCYQLVNANYPLARQTTILVKQSAVDQEVIDTKKLPEFSVAAQATYQSDVISIPIPNAGIDPPNKDQYKATLSVNQLIYGGGAINASLAAEAATLKTKQKEVEVNLYQLKKQVNQLYFSILLTQKKEALLISKQQLLNSRLDEVKSGVKNGVLLPASDKVLETELLKIKQGMTEIKQNKISLIQTLSSIIGTTIPPTVILLKPELTTENQVSVRRPELELFQLKKYQIETAEQLMAKQNSPKLMGFAQGGYGNPGLNMLDNSFQPFYIVGLKISWTPFDWNANKKQRQSLSINKEFVDNEAELFNLKTSIELEQQQTEIDKYSAFIDTDVEIVDLRKEVLKSAESQLKNGVITASAYLTELTNLYEDENTMCTHEIQLMLMKANYNITKGL
ncbi:MAG TPA: TolC family protein [Fulvivirga sp.]|nr:TolC family protein [Fulvivirga sp.]